MIWIIWFMFVGSAGLAVKFYEDMTYYRDAYNRVCNHK